CTEKLPRHGAERVCAVYIVHPAIGIGKNDAIFVFYAADSFGLVGYDTEDGSRRCWARTETNRLARGSTPARLGTLSRRLAPKADCRCLGRECRSSQPMDCAWHSWRRRSAAHATTLWS